MRFIHYILTLLLALLFFTNCNEYQQNSKKSTAKVEEIDKLRTFIDEYPFINEEFKNIVKDSCLKFYTQRNFGRVWFENDTVFPGQQIVHFYNYLNNDTLLNVIPRHYPVKQLAFFEKSWLNEIQVFIRLSHYLNTRKSGLFNFRDTTIVAPGLSPNDAVDSFIQSKPDSLTWTDHLINYKTKNKSIIELHRSLNEFCKDYPIKNSSCSIDTSSLESSAKNCLEKLGYTKTDSASFTSTLRSFQYNNGIRTDGVIGKRTISHLKKSNFQRYLEGIITLDYLRQNADSILPKKIIRVNIPAYEIILYNQDTIAFKGRVIVGKPKTKTPVFQSKVKYIVTNPYWHVPYSIARKETLYAIKKDTAVMREKGYEILKDGKVINPDSIEWSNYHRNFFPFKIRQKFGPLNSLGHEKLLFPNKYSVYIHDTPGKHLFQHSRRAYSHGCIRTQFADSLMKTILKLENHAYLDSLDTLYARDKETYLQLHDNFPVSIEYQTTIVDDSTENLRIYPDIYGRLTDFIELAKP